jgi:hypothetical protein
MIRLPALSVATRLYALFALLADEFHNAFLGALSQLDELTQQNSALVEQRPAAAKALKRQSKAMDERVGFFRLAADVSPFSLPSAAMDDRKFSKRRASIRA